MADSPPYDPRAVANLLLDIADDMDVPVSNLALQKLLYFAHGHHLIRTGTPLVAGAFEAWKNGPVQPAVYHAFKSAGREPIAFRATGRNVMTGELRVLPLPRAPSVAQHLRRILEDYGHLSPGLLVGISHAKGGPWAAVRNQAAQGSSLGDRIPDSLIRERFGKQWVEVRPDIVDAVLDDDAPLEAAVLSAGLPRRV